ncbi:MAG TPA: hypothetical protein VGL81_00040 [Polyangiaceae bacterium]
MTLTRKMDRRPLGVPLAAFILVGASGCASPPIPVAPGCPNGRSEVTAQVGACTAGSQRPPSSQEPSDPVQPSSPAPTAPVAPPVVADQPATERRQPDSTRVEFASPRNGLEGVPAFLRSHAAGFIPCPVEQLSVERLRTSPNPWFSSFLVDGCGKRVAYGLCETTAGDCYTVTAFFSVPSRAASKASGAPAPDGSAPKAATGTVSPTGTWGSGE